MLGSTLYRLVKKTLVTREEVLHSGSARFNNGDDPPTTYAADGPETAKKEIEARAGVRIDPKGVRLWKIHCGAVLQEILNLLSADERAAGGITLDELVADPPSNAGREFAQNLRDKGAVGFAYPSVRNAPDGVCVVLFLENAGWAVEIEPADQEWEDFLKAAGLDG